LKAFKRNPAISFSQEAEQEEKRLKEKVNR
jgi:hypothetical protein